MLGVLKKKNTFQNQYAEFRKCLFYFIKYFIHLAYTLVIYSYNLTSTNIDC